MDQALAFLVANFWTIAGALFAACLTAYLTGRNGRKVRYAAACSTFRAAVLTELGTIYPVPSNWPENINAFLREVFPKLQAAVAQFRPFVPWWRRRSFDRAWFNYHCATGRSIDTQVYHHYMPFSGQLEPKSTFRKNVSQLLSFATET